MANAKNAAKAGARLGKSAGKLAGSRAKGAAGSAKRKVKGAKNNNTFRAGKAVAKGAGQDVKGNLVNSPVGRGAGKAKRKAKSSVSKAKAGVKNSPSRKQAVGVGRAAAGSVKGNVVNSPVGRAPGRAKGAAKRASNSQRGNQAKAIGRLAASPAKKYPKTAVGAGGTAAYGGAGYTTYKKRTKKGKSVTVKRSSRSKRK